MSDQTKESKMLSLCEDLIHFADSQASHDTATNLLEQLRQYFDEAAKLQELVSKACTEIATALEDQYKDFSPETIKQIETELDVSVAETIKSLKSPFDDNGNLIKNFVEASGRAMTGLK